MALKIGRNDPCPCGSGKKYKKCCMNKQATSDKEQIIHKIGRKIDKGYDRLEVHQTAEACDMWWEAWKDIQKWLIPHYPTSSILSFSDKISSDFSIYNWIQDFEMELKNAGMEENRFNELRYVLAFEFRKFFPKSNPLILMNMGTAAAQSLFYLGRNEEGEKLFKKLIVGDYDENERSWIYIRWGDIYADGTSTLEVDTEKAKALYEKAIDLIDEDDRSAVEDRLKNLEIR